jgi:uncharacterized Zn finger protein
MARHRDWERYTPSPPLPVSGGVRSRTRRGHFAQEWWGRRWIEHLEEAGAGVAARLARGRRYARQGQVVSLDITPGQISAQVQGSRPKPYRVTLAVPTFSAGEAARLAAVLTGEARFAASLLIGNLPPEAEQAAAAAGLDLFPRRLETRCSCPDWANPCKHVAAVHYLVAEELDRRPMLLLTLRGLDPGLLVQGLALPEGDGGGADPSPLREMGDGLEGKAPDADPWRFWLGEGERSPVPAPVAAPGGAPLVSLLGPFPFWQGDVDLVRFCRQVLAEAAAEGERLLTDEDVPGALGSE